MGWGAANSCGRRRVMQGARCRLQAARVVAVRLVARLQLCSLQAAELQAARATRVALQAARLQAARSCKLQAAGCMRSVTHTDRPLRVGGVKSIRDSHGSVSVWIA